MSPVVAGSFTDKLVQTRTWRTLSNVSQLDFHITMILPQFSHLLKKNHPLLEVEMHAIRDAIEHFKKNLSRIDETIAHLGQSLAKLSRERVEVEKSIEDHTRILSPIRQLPPEILSEIFMACLPSRDEVKRFGRIGVHCAPVWGLSHVSRHWRQITLSNPRLWSCITINLELRSRQWKPLDDRLAYPFHLVKTWLVRSADVPLTIVFWCCTGVSFHSLQLLELFIAQSHRWKAVDLWLGGAHYRKLNDVTGRVPLLQRLRIEANLRGITSPITAFQIAPRLHDVAVKFDGPSDFDFPLALPWEQVTWYDEESRDSNDAVRIRCVDNVVRCRLAFHDPHPPVSSFPARLSHLSHLNINTSKFLDDLTLPALQELVIADAESPDDALAPLVRLLDRSSCSLRKIFLLDGKPVISTLIQILQNAPSLVELGIHVPLSDVSITDELLKQLTNASHLPQLQGRASSGPCLVPNLEVLQLAIDGPLDHGPFVDMVESRWRVGSIDSGCRCLPLRVVGVVCGKHRNENSQSIARLAEMQSEGFSLMTLLPRDKRSEAW